jgi:uncharacterized repeat protein (TIGR03803 family)
MRSLAMRRTCFPCILGRSFFHRFLTIVALAVALMSTAWAQPKFKILATVPGGLWSGLTFDAKGNLYGVTGAGGDDNQGTVFELSPGAHGWTLTTLHSFNGTDGGTPNGGLIFDAAGNLYGTTQAGGSGRDGGTVFEMTPGSAGWTFNVVYDFCQEYRCPDGGAPDGGLVIDGLGNLYGTAAAGGLYSQGVAFELTANSGQWAERVLYSFLGVSTGYDPSGPLVLDLAGNLYGTTAAGSTAGGGSVFRLKRSAGGEWKERILYGFCSTGFPLCKDGLHPYAGVVFDGAGDLYGTTSQGGGSRCGETTCGIVFKLTKASNRHWGEAVLYDFPSPANGSFPSSSVIFDKAGNLYGTTSGGGNSSCSGGCGVVYKLTLSAGGKWKYTVLHKFTGQDGGYPDGGVVLDSKGNLYGTAYSVVYEITP